MTRSKDRHRRMHPARWLGLHPLLLPGPVSDFAAAKKANTKVYADFFHGMLERGFYLPPAQLEAGFISLAHTDAEIDSFIAAAQETLATLHVLR
jgi:glutamate-1-semialdehyde 2,1-aminomutase